jgi:hypothetical protein
MVDSENACFIFEPVSGFTVSVAGRRSIKRRIMDFQTGTLLASAVFMLILAFAFRANAFLGMLAFNLAPFLLAVACIISALLNLGFSFSG